MPKLKSVESLGAKAIVHMLDFELDGNVLGGARIEDPFDSDRVREAANLIKRVCSKQRVSGDYAVSSFRDASGVSVQCGFLSVADRDAIASIALAEPAATGEWASRRHFVLQAQIVENLTSAGVPRDNRGPGRRARQKAQEQERELGPR